MSEEPSRLAAELEALINDQPREAGSEGEFAMIDTIKGRIATAEKPRIEGFVGHSSPEVVVGIHALLLLIVGLVGMVQPALAAGICALVTASLVAEGIGTMSAVRWVLRKSPSYNLVAKLPAKDAVGTVVFVAPLDSRRWRPQVAGRMIKRPLKGVLAAALVVTVIVGLRALAEPWGKPTIGLYVGSLAVLAVTMVVGAIAHRRHYVGSGDVSDLAVVVELLHRFHERPTELLDAYFLFAGCSRAHQDGVHAFIDRREKNFKRPVLFIGLEEPSRVPLAATVSEGSLWAQHHRPTGPALIERLRWAGVKISMMDRPGATNSRAAMARGFRAMTICGGDGQEDLTQVEAAADVAERVARWFEEDLARSVSGKRTSEANEFA